MRRVALSFLASVLLSLLSAGTAYAGYYGQTWLNWVYTEGGSIQWSGFTDLKQVGVQPKAYDWGCANLWNGSNYVFSGWYCAEVGYAIYTSNLGGEGVWAEPVVWNDNSTGQDLWGWEYYYA